jgi:NAD(P)-dependent dehydrogenase (short-subunit alcohol dehydrogenase family)
MANKKRVLSVKQKSHLILNFLFRFYIVDRYDVNETVSTIRYLTKTAEEQKGRPMHRFEEKVILITGGTSGMGLAAAKRFLDEGAWVIITGRRQDKLDTIAHQLNKEDHLLPVQADATNLKALDLVFKRITETYGYLDVVFANAGIGTFKPVAEFSEEDFDHLVNVNFKGVFFTIQKALPLLRNGGAVIINASWTLYRGNGTNALYSATKAAVHNLARTIAEDVAARQIRVNSISPGYINTEQFNESSLPAGEASRRKHEVPLGRFGTPDEIARAVAFLASDDASYITGQDILIDGGLVTTRPG